MIPPQQGIPSRPPVGIPPRTPFGTGSSFMSSRTSSPLGARPAPGAANKPAAPAKIGTLFEMQGKRGYMRNQDIERDFINWTQQKENRRFMKLDKTTSRNMIRKIIPQNQLGIKEGQMKDIMKQIRSKVYENRFKSKDPNKMYQKLLEAYTRIKKY